MSLIDPATNQAYVSSKDFIFIIRVKDTSRLSKVNTGVLGSEFGLFTKDECDKMFLQVKYIASDREIRSNSKVLTHLKPRENFYIIFGE